MLEDFPHLRILLARSKRFVSRKLIRDGILAQETTQIDTCEGR